MIYLEKNIDLVAIGHALVDIRIVIDRFPHPDEESNVVKQSWGSGGSAVNVAIAGKKLGLSTAIIAKIGYDSFGRIVVEDLLKENVDISGLRVSFSQTGFTIVVIDSNGNIMMYGYKGAAEELEPDNLSEYVISRSRWMHIASLRLDTTLRALELAKKHGVKTSWDPGRVLSQRPWNELKEIISRVDVVLANENEYRNMMGEQDYRVGARKVLESGAKIAVVKRGERGVYVKTEDLEEEIPAYLVKEVVDTTGAGDAFAAGFIAGMLRNYNIKKAIAYANAVAALKITKLGSHEVPLHRDVINFLWEAETRI